MYYIAQKLSSRNFGGSFTVQKHFGRKDIGRLAALCSKSARIKILVDKIQQIGHETPNPPKFSTAQILCYVVAT